MSRLLTPRDIKEFKSLLANYSLHKSGLKQFKDSNFGVIAGPAGAGKDTLRNGLTEQHPELYVQILSTTTRPPRVGEEEGVTYYFREVAEVQNDLRQHEFFQAELVHNQQVSCLHLDEIRKLGSGQTGLGILITETERKLTAIKPDIKTVFLIPPDLPTLLKRMQSQRVLNDAEIGRRLEAARKEIEYALQARHYYCLLSDTVEHVTSRAHLFLHEDKKDDTVDKQSRKVMQQVLNTLNDW